MDHVINALERHLDASPTALEERIRILESVLESMGDGVAVVDEHGTFVLINSAAKRIYGRGPTDGPMDRWSELYGVLRADGLTPYPADQLPLARALRGEATDQVELFFRNIAHPDGIFVASTGRPLRDADGRIRGGIVVLRDISAHKRAEVELRETNERLNHLLGDQARRAQQSRVLAEMSSLLQATTNVDELYAVIADYMERLFTGAQGAFFAYSASRDDLEQKSWWGGFPADEQPMLKPSECWGLRRGRVHRVDGTSARMRCAHIPETLDDGSLCVPVLGPDETLGLLHIRFTAAGDEAGRDRSAPLWEEREQVTATAAEYLGLALVNLRLRLALQQQSIRDPLTGLFNRRFLEETLPREMRRAVRKRSTLCVLMLDIDNFKGFNDRYGHAAGDNVLREFSAVLLDNIRNTDIASRYGGEEFMVVLPDAPLADARNKAEQILEKTKALRVTFNGSGLGPISVSIGLACCPEHCDNAQGLVRAADQALYAAKQGGRDRVEVFTRALGASTASV
jgi:diguanylate cyclase (GGDEF)-like protein